jgi:polygalacturonase
VTLLIDAGAALFSSRDPRDYDLTPGSCGVVNLRGCGLQAVPPGEAGAGLWHHGRWLDSAGAAGRHRWD